MSAIGPGSWLECTRAAKARDGSYSIQPGAVYRCSGFVPTNAGERWTCSFCGLSGPEWPELEGMRHRAWCSCCFKPAGYLPSEEIRRLLKAPSSVREDA